MTWLDFKIGVKLLGNFVDEKFLEINMGIGLIISIYYQISGNDNATIYTLFVVILFSLYEVRRKILEQLDNSKIS